MKTVFWMMAAFIGLLICWAAWEFGTNEFSIVQNSHALAFHLGLLIGVVAIGHLLAAKLSWPLPDLRLALFSGCLSWVFLEMGLRIIEQESTYIEERSGWYQSAYVQARDNPMRIHLYEKEFRMTSPEFDYPRTVNSHGLSDIGFRKKLGGETLIQTYGDSFTEGDGAPQDSAYPSLLRTMLNSERQDSVLVQNFGISGNDPAFYWNQLKHIGRSFDPDVVIITYGSLDMTVDFFTRGGMGRFKDDRWSALPPPWWEFVYASSYVFRAVANNVFGVRANLFLATERQAEQRLIGLRPEWNQVFDSISSLAAQHDFKVLLLKKPERSEVDKNSYECDFDFFSSHIENDTSFVHFDLLHYYRSERGLNKDNTFLYYWDKDGHHNPTGYHLMASGVFDALRTHFPELVVQVDQAGAVLSKE